MGAGIIVRDASGNVVMDLTTRVTRIIGFVTVTGPGSLTADFSTGTPFAVVASAPSNDGPTYQVNVACSWSGNTMSWADMSGRSSWPTGIRIMYGVY